MATTVQPVQQIDDSGETPTDIHSAIVAAPNINAFQNYGRTVLFVTANSTGPVTVTLKNQTSEDGNPGPDKVIVVPTSGTRVIANITAEFFNLGSATQVTVDTPANLAAFYAFTA